MNNAARVGLLLIVAVVLSAIGLGFLGESFLSKSDTYFAVLPDATGVSPGTRVLMAGVKVGTVKLVALEGPTTAKLTLSINPGTKLPEGTTVVLPSSLVGLGDTPVTLVPLPGSTSMLAPGAELVGRKAGPLDTLFPDGGKGAYTELTKTMAAVRKLLEDQKFTGGINNLLATTNKTLETSQETLKQFAALAKNGNNLLTSNQATLTATLTSARDSLQNVKSATGELARFAQKGTLQKGTTDLLAKANAMAEKADKLLASVSETMNDPELKANLKTVTKNLAVSSESGPRLAKNMEEITGNFKTISEKSTNLPDKIAILADKAAALEDQLSELLKKVGGVFGKSSGSGLSQLSTQMDLLRESRPGYWRTDVNAAIPTSDGFVTFGVFDAFESNRLNLQVGKHLGPKMDARYGIYASKPSLGVDYRLSPKLGLRTDLFDINTPRFDARLRYEFGNGIIGWLGVDRVFRDNAAVIGIGIRK